MEQCENCGQAAELLTSSSGKSVCEHCSPGIFRTHREAQKAANAVGAGGNQGTRSETPSARSAWDQSSGRTGAKFERAVAPASNDRSTETNLVTLVLESKQAGNRWLVWSTCVAVIFAVISFVDVVSLSGGGMSSAGIFHLFVTCTLSNLVFWPTLLGVWIVIYRSLNRQH